ncbi:hypothetical protein MAR_010109 [Mya arenaria]|uniref:Uncharacterized protein n=1 Tax=Mya arenaria TaxID=6604 RepID=A0ABY7E8S0_MYAAR|nr:hypothetical protein MAR_010109 [Mya arenaria]
MEAKCNCPSRGDCVGGPRRSSCREISYFTKVWQRTGCTNGVYDYKEMKRAVQAIVIHQRRVSVVEGRPGSM